MPLEFLPLPHLEWPTYFRIANDAFVPGILSVMYPEGMTDAAIDHGVASLERGDAAHPGRMHMFKVVDTELPDSDPFDKVVGVSQWKIFPERSEEDMKKEDEETEKDHEEYGAPPGFNVEMGTAFGDATTEYKKKHLGGKPYVLLHVLATRTKHHRRGVGALSLKWGTEKADELGLPAYLEASPMGAPLYRKFGWKDVDILPFDATEYGYHDKLTHICMLRPARTEGEQ